MGAIEDRIKEVEEEIQTTLYNKKSMHHIGKLKAKLARLREESELQRSKGGGGGKRFAVKKSGHATVALLGAPNTGKSTLLNKITEATSEVGNFAFTTKDIFPGVVTCSGAKIQILDMPGILSGAASGRGRGREVLGVARSADLIVIFIDVFNPDIGAIVREAHEVGIRMNARPPEITIAKRDRGGITISSTGPLRKLDEATARAILNEFGIVNGDVLFRRDSTPEDLIDALSQSSRSYVPAIVVLNKIDMITAQELRARLEALKGWKVYPISADKGLGLEELKMGIYNALGFRHIYLKPQGGGVDRKVPLILKRGGTVGDVCDLLHKEFRKKFRYAFVWGSSVKYGGQRVGIVHEMADGDVLTIVVRI